MTEYSKSTPDAPEEKGENPEMMFPLAVATLFHKGVEMLADLQKSTLDMYAHHTVDTINTLKQVFPAVPAPGMFYVDVAGQGFGRLIEMQKGMVDLMVRQSAAGVDGLKQRSSSASKAAGGVTNLIRDAAPHSIALGVRAHEPAIYLRSSAGTQFCRIHAEARLRPVSAGLGFSGD